MAVKNRGLPSEVGGFYDQFEIEIIQRDTASWCPDNLLFSEWVSAIDVADTGVRSGLSQSSWGPGAGGDLPVDLLGEQEIVQNEAPLPRLTHSAKQYANMMNFGMPCTPVHSGAERRKFASKVGNHLSVPGDRMGRLQSRQRINYDSWAVEWN